MSVDPSDAVLIGTIKIVNGRVMLVSGSLEAEIKARAGKGDAIRAADGKAVRLKGKAVAGTVEQAELLPQVESAPAETVSRFGAVIAAIEAEGPRLKETYGAVSVRPGFRRAAGHLTNEPAIVVAVTRKKPPADLASAELLPRSIGGIPVDVVTANPADVLEGGDEAETWRRVLFGGAEAAGKPSFHYEPPPKTLVELSPCEIHNVLCHVGPDSGWQTLQPFLAATRSQLTVTMYDFTADQIVDALVDLARDDRRKLNLILQQNSNEVDNVDRLKRGWKQRLSFQRAAVGRIFKNSFHSKVAVRDGKAMWLSSGNWSPRSQPVIPAGPNPSIYRRGNREWHVVIEDKPLSTIFEKFIRYDMKQAAAVAVEEAAEVMPDLLVPEAAFLELEAAVVQPAPFAAKQITRSQHEAAIPVQPLMTPDNYGEAILKLIDGARDSLFMQYSYIRGPTQQDMYRNLIDAVGRKMRQGVDVRVIVDSRNQKDSDVDLVLTLGWDRARWRKQTSAVHNKGILVDGHLTVVGSQNWSGDGTQVNRDASLIFDAVDIYDYFNGVFQFDWDNLTKPIETPEITPIIADPSKPTPAGMVRVPWRTWYQD